MREIQNSWRCRPVRCGLKQSFSNTNPHPLPSLSLAPILITGYYLHWARAEK